MLRNESGVVPDFSRYIRWIVGVTNPNGIPIQIGRRFIQNVEFRPHGIDRGKGQQLLFSARHGKDVSSPSAASDVGGQWYHPADEGSRYPSYALIFRAKG